MIEAASSPSLTRRRTVDWQDPGAVRAAAQGLTGLEIMHGIRDGTLPPPPMARMLGIDCIRAEPGEVVMELDPQESLENTIGMPSPRRCWTRPWAAPSTRCCQARRRRSRWT